MKHKSWSEPFISAHPELIIIVKEERDFDFLKDKYYALEIGTGRGDFLLTMASKDPSRLWIGVEMNVDALAITAKKIVNSGLKNVLLIRQNFQTIAPLFPKERCTNIFLNFSDPWPKKRHAKRRLTSKSFLMEYERLLMTKGSLVMKTDNSDLFTYSLTMIEESALKIEDIDEHYAFDEEHDAMTEYESKFRQLGQPIYRLIARKE